MGPAWVPKSEVQLFPAEDAPTNSKETPSLWTARTMVVPQLREKGVTEADNHPQVVAGAAVAKSATWLRSS